MEESHSGVSDGQVFLLSGKSNFEANLDDLSSAIDVEFRRISTEFYDHGYQDGMRGKMLRVEVAEDGSMADPGKGYKKRRLMEPFARNRVEIVQNFIEGQLAGKADSLSNQISSIESNNHELIGLKKDREEKLSWIEATEKVKSTVGAYLSLIGYSSIGVFLILADIVLALKLTQAGLDLPRDPNYPFKELFHSPLMILAINWETVVVSIGIGLCTIYIKIFYDEFVGVRLTKRILLKKLMRSLDQDLVRSVRREMNVRTGIKIIFLIVTLTTIVALGFMRFESAGITVGTSSVSLVSKIAFIAITLLFPIIGGICFSIAFKRISISNKFTLLSSKVLELSKRIDYQMIEMRKANSYLARINSYMRTFISLEFKANHIEYLVAAYLNGYQEGVLKSDRLNNGRSHYERVSALRKKMTSLRVYSKVQPRFIKKRNVVDYVIFQN